LGRHIARHFVRHQAAEFPEQAAKAVGTGFFFSHQSQLVLNQRMVNQVHMGFG
jgi:hypothetical protein